MFQSPRSGKFVSDKAAYDILNEENAEFVSIP